MKLLLAIVLFLQSPADINKAATADMDAGRWADAAARFEQILKDDATNIGAQMNLALCLGNLGNKPRAIELYRKVLTQDAGIFEARMNLGVLLEQTDDFAGADNQFQKAAALQPQDPAPRLYRDRLQRRVAETARRKKLDVALAHFNRKAYADAVVLFEELAASEADNVEYLYMVGKCQLELKEYPKSIATLKRALQAKPDHVDALSAIGSSYYFQQDWANAIVAWERFAQFKPKVPIAYFMLATSYDRLNNVPKALLNYNKFLELDDKSNDARSFQARERAKTLERRKTP